VLTSIALSKESWNFKSSDNYSEINLAAAMVDMTLSGNSLTSAKSSWPSARSSLQRAIRYTPSDPGLWLALALNLRKELADSCLSLSEEELEGRRTKLLATIESLEHVLEQVDTLSQRQANNCIRLKRHVEASRYEKYLGWSQLIRADCYVLQAKLCSESDIAVRLQKAIEVAEGIITAGSEGGPIVEANGYRVLAHALHCGESYGDAISAFRRSLEKNASSLEVWEVSCYSYKFSLLQVLIIKIQELASAYSELGFVKQAMQCHKQSLSLIPEGSPQRITPLLRLAILALMILEVDVANESVREALKIDSNSLPGRLLQVLMMSQAKSSANTSKIKKILANLRESHIDERYVEWVSNKTV
jgi:tetratricopeptide (TPR) repeat protein